MTLKESIPTAPSRLWCLDYKALKWGEMRYWCLVDTSEQASLDALDLVAGKGHNTYSKGTNRRTIEQA
jgi:hypothetical protein